MAPPPKRRRIVSAVEEVTYDPVARQEYLSGFRKRKQQRIKQAQQVAKEKERLQKIDDRRSVSGAHGTNRMGTNQAILRFGSSAKKI